MAPKKAPKTHRAVGYVRVSTSEQSDSGLGLAAQRSSIEIECTRRGWVLQHIYEDAGASGKTMKGRPGLSAALGAVEKHEADSIVVAKLDRVSRSLQDFSGLLARARKRGWNLVAIDLGIDLSTPNGELVANVMASVAQWEARAIGQRTSDALQAKKAAGARLGRPVDLPEAVRVRIAKERRRGKSLREIAAKLDRDSVATARGGRWQPETVAGVLRSVALDA